MAKYIPTIDVCGNEVPLPAYWKIIERFEQGHSAADIVSEILKIVGSSDRRRVEDIVMNIIDNQSRMMGATDRADASLTDSRSGRRFYAERGPAISAPKQHGDDDMSDRQAFRLLKKGETVKEPVFMVTTSSGSSFVVGPTWKDALKRHSHGR